MIEFLSQQSKKKKHTLNYQMCTNAVILHKCILHKLLYDSPYVFNQFMGIDDSISHQLVVAGVTTYEKLLKMKPDDVDSIKIKNPSFAKILLETANKLPRYSIQFKMLSEFQVRIRCRMINLKQFASFEDGITLGTKQPIMLVVGDEKNHLLMFEKME